MRLAAYAEDLDFRGWYFMRGPRWAALHLGRWTVMYFKRLPK